MALSPFMGLCQSPRPAARRGVGVISLAGGAVVLGAVGDGWMLEAEPVVVPAQDDRVERQWTVMRTAQYVTALTTAKAHRHDDPQSLLLPDEVVSVGVGIDGYP